MTHILNVAGIFIQEHMSGNVKCMYASDPGTLLIAVGHMRYIY